MSKIHRLTVFAGGAGGLMGALAHTLSEGGGVIGVIPKIFHAAD